MNTKLNQDTGHRGTDLAGVARISLGAANVLNSSLLVGDSNLSDLAVHLEEDLAETSLLAQRTDGKKLKNEDLALLEFHVELFSNLRSRKEVTSWHNRQVAKLGCDLLVVLKDLGVHNVRGNVALGDGRTELLAHLALDLDKVNGLEVETRTLLQLPASAKGVCAERLGEATVGLAHQTFEEFKHRAREVKLRGTSLDVLGRQLVGHHELGKITNNLGGGGNLDNVAKQVVGMLIGLLGLKPLGSETKLRSLEHHIGQLTTRNLVLVNFGIGSGEMGLEGRVEQTQLRPVGVKSADLLGVQTGVKVAALQRGDDGVDARLGGHSRQAVGGGIDSIGTSLGASNHGGNTRSSRVVGVNVNWQVRVLLADASNQEFGSVGLQHTGHILDTKNVDIEGNKLLDKVHVVGQVVLLGGVEHITRDTNSTFNNTASLVNGLDADFELGDVVQGIKDSENVDTILLGLLDEVLNGVVGQGRVGHTVGSTKKHLEGDVGDQLSHLAQTVE